MQEACQLGIGIEKGVPVQELETVVADRSALQTRMTSLAATHELEMRQLHADKAGLQVTVMSTQDI